MGNMHFAFSDMIFICALALILFGPKKLPEISRQIGKGLADLRRAGSEFRIQIEDEVRSMEIEQEYKAAMAPMGALAAFEPDPGSYSRIVRDSSFDSADNSNGQHA